MSLADQVPDFSALRVAVVGDLIADHYLYGRPTRLSHEAPVMILRYQREEIGAGGAANVARNLWALGARTRLIGAVGCGDSGRSLLAYLAEDPVGADEIESVESWTTPTKTRVLGAASRRTPQQMLRIDREPEGPLEAAAVARLAEHVRGLAGEVDVLIASDYGYGTITEAMAAAIGAVERAGARVFVDPRDTMHLFEGVAALMPNLPQLAAYSGRATDELDDPAVLADCAHALIEAREVGWLLVTRGNRGMALFSRELDRQGVYVDASGADEIVDVSGAGDTAIATFALALAAGVDGPHAMRMANAAAGVVVMESGTAVCTASKLRTALAGAPTPEPGPA